MNKEFTGDRGIYIEIKNYLYEKGFSILDAIHIGNDRYEFKETWSNKLGCHDLHKILAWKENGKIQYKNVIVGNYCCD